MKAAANPWMKFYPADWRADAMLRLCSIAARGLWAEMMCIMHAATPYGSLLVNERRIDKRQLAGLAGVSEKECCALLFELEGNGVFSRDEDGTIYSRRMRRDHERADEGRISVKRKWGEGASNHQKRSQRLTEARIKGRHTPEEWGAMLHICDNKCVRCESNEKIVRDHIVPIYQGGSDGIENIQPLCSKCNSSKGAEAKDFRRFDWEKRLGECLGRSNLMPTQKLEARSQKQKEPREVALDWPSDFREQFWAKFPNKVGKPKALTKLEAVCRRGVPWLEVMDGLDRYIRSKPPDRAWLNPETFINQERWADQPAETSNGKTSGIIAASDKLRVIIDSFDQGSGGSDEVRSREGEDSVRLLSKRWG
jgi:5-methylcytosine-specific restriction endonuclease McrA